MSSIEASNLFSVKGVVAVVTGGGSGIGLMMTKALAANGARKVYIVGRRLAVLESAASSISPSGIVSPIQGDVTSKDDLARISAQVKSEVGYLNVLICNSGIAGPTNDGLKPNPSLKEFKDYLWAHPPEEFSRTFAVNVSGVFYTTLAFLELLDAGNKAENRAGSKVKSQVIATSSIAGFNRKLPAGFSYGSSKAALTHLMKSLSTALIPYHIRTNIIAPGIYPSDMAGPLIGDRDPTEEGAFEPSIIPIGRAGTVEDMSGVVLYLCSRAGGYSNGCVVITDGGRLGVMPATY
ncbi:MAG: hypothetical protein M1819_003366 [Sarea resinae]|nr:MAG: hypothetical protein M1819_003366 [Sarea resinae]